MDLSGYRVDGMVVLGDGEERGGVIYFSVDFSGRNGLLKIQF